MKKLMGQFVQTIIEIGKIRDPYTTAHERRVAEISVLIAREMGRSRDQIEGIEVAALLHDLGKVGVPTEILSKPGKLNEYEVGIIQDHSEVGYKVIDHIDFTWPVSVVIHQHHERLDGSGYPQGLRGDDILLESKIVAVADVVQAMSTHRPYRAAHSIKEALNEIEKYKGILFEEDVVDSCTQLFNKGVSI